METPCWLTYRVVSCKRGRIQQSSISRLLNNRYLLGRRNGRCQPGQVWIWDKNQVSLPLQQIFENISIMILCLIRCWRLSYYHYYYYYCYYYCISETRLKWMSRGHTIVSILSGCRYVLNVERRTGFHCSNNCLLLETVMGKYSMLFNVFIEGLRRSRFNTYHQETCIGDRTR